MTISCVHDTPPPSNGWDGMHGEHTTGGKKSCGPSVLTQLDQSLKLGEGWRMNSWNVNVSNPPWERLKVSCQ